MANPITKLKNTASNNTNLKVWLSVCLLLVSFIPGFYYMHIGVDFCDESYQIINARDYLNTPLAPLTAYASHWLTDITVNILLFRYFSFFLLYSAIFCAGGFLYSRTRNISVSLMATAAAICVTGMSEFKGWLYGWDSFSYCTVTLVCIGVLSYIFNTNLKWLIITAILSAVTTLCRIPNIVCIFIIGGVIFTIQICRKNGFYKAVSHSFAYIILSLLCCLAGIILIYGGLSAYIDSLHANAISEHSLSMLISKMVDNGVKYIPFVVGLVCIWLVIKFTFKLRNEYMRISVFVILTGIIITGVLMPSIPVTFMNAILNGVILLGCVALICHKKDLNTVLAGIALFLLCFVPCVGSNTGCFKILIGGMIPLLMACLYKYWNKTSTVFVIIVLIVYITGSISKRMYTSFSDVGSLEAKALATKGPMSGLKTSENMVKAINSAFTDTETYINAGYDVKVLGFSIHRFGWELTFDDYNPALRHWWSFGDFRNSVKGYKEYVNKVVHSEKPVLVFWSNSASPASISKDIYEVDKTWEIDTLRKYMTELPTSSQAYQLYTNVPLH